MRTVSILNKLLLFLFSLSLLSCRNVKNKDKLKAIIPICDQRLFVEKYEVWGGGAYGGDMISAYLTDSVNFRKYLRTYDNAHESIAFECKGKDSVSIYKQVLDTNSNKFKIVSTTVYSILELRARKEFD
ncbi:MAG TPA: hypothetical protein VFN30_00010 [Chitinophagaceae bacterium]|nr:hypothetical protein [Chitinophagaceae bacterium]